MTSISFSGKKLLLVEDNPVIALDAQLFLMDAGAIVSAATTVLEALDLIARSEPDFAILDVNFSLWKAAFRSLTSFMSWGSRSFSRRDMAKAPRLRPTWPMPPWSPSPIEDRGCSPRSPKPRGFANRRVSRGAR